MLYGVHERLRSHRGVDLTGKPRDLAFACYQYKVNAEVCQGRPIYKTKAMKGEMGWENVKLGIVENEPVSETFRKRTNARKCWLNSDKELNHLSTVS